jgi:hypothetical protein
VFVLRDPLIDAISMQALPQARSSELDLENKIRRSPTATACAY